MRPVETVENSPIRLIPGPQNVEMDNEMKFLMNLHTRIVPNSSFVRETIEICFIFYHRGFFFHFSVECSRTVHHRH